MSTQTGWFNRLTGQFCSPKIETVLSFKNRNTIWNMLCAMRNLVCWLMELWFTLAEKFGDQMNLITIKLEHWYMLYHVNHHYETRLRFLWPLAWLKISLNTLSRLTYSKPRFLLNPTETPEKRKFLNVLSGYINEILVGKWFK